MCGITGYWNFLRDENVEKMRSQIQDMTNAMFLRGPDSGGAWLDRAEGLALGMRRLAVRELSTHGHQPMLSKSGKHVLVYNGEIYNTEELRQELQAVGASFRGASDTEVVLQACICWGPEKTLRKILGMFAFAFWDSEKRELFLARDRFGEKPLYWGCQRNVFFFASELKAIRTHTAWEGVINRDSLGALLRYNFIPSPASIYNGIYKLEPGYFLRVNNYGITNKNAYWRALDSVLRNKSNELDCSQEEFINKLDDILSESVRRCMAADVPIGAFLSGGIDSSLIVSLMQKNMTSPVHSFSIGFTENEYNEAPYAKAIAKHLGTKHTEVYMEPKDAWALIPKLPSIYDEPFADPSQLPTSLLSAIASRDVTVALSGDGGDELFGGYGRYAHCIGHYPKPASPLRALLSNLPRQIPLGILNRVASFVPKKWRPLRAGERLHNYALRSGADRSAFYHNFYLSYWWYPETVVLGIQNHATCLKTDNAEVNQISDLLAFMQYADITLYLPDDILIKVDRASMAYSLETRIPFLDYRIYDFACSIPVKKRFQGSLGKMPLRQLLKRYVPEELFERPKMGFGIPLDKWLRGPLREWAEDLLAPKRLENEGFFVTDTVRYAWQKHLTGESDWQGPLWSILMFQAWLASPLETYKVDQNFPIAEASYLPH